jgi:MinD-like ATPase involved in chromosome partitioning or flagellar assembly
VDLPTYTNIWRIEKRLYKLYDLRLPMPLPLVQIGVFVGVFVPWIVLLRLIGIPFGGGWILPLYLVPPAVLTWLGTRPVIEGKRLTELLLSQARYVTEPRTWCRLTPIREPAEVVVVARVWRRAGAPAPVAAAERAAIRSRRKAAKARKAHKARPAQSGRHALPRPPRVPSPGILPTSGSAAAPQRISQGVQQAGAPQVRVRAEEPGPLKPPSFGDPSNAPALPVTAAAFLRPAEPAASPAEPAVRPGERAAAPPATAGEEPPPTMPELEVPPAAPAEPAPEQSGAEPVAERRSAPADQPVGSGKRGLVSGVLRARDGGDPWRQISQTDAEQLAGRAEGRDPAGQAGPEPTAEQTAERADTAAEDPSAGTEAPRPEPLSVPRPWSNELSRPPREARTDALVWPPPPHKRGGSAPAEPAKSPQPATPAAAARPGTGPDRDRQQATPPPQPPRPAQYSAAAAPPVTPAAAPPVTPPAGTPPPGGRTTAGKPVWARSTGPWRVSGTAPPAGPPRPPGTPIKPPPPRVVPEAPQPPAEPPREGRSGPASPVRPEPRSRARPPAVQGPAAPFAGTPDGRAAVPDQPDGRADAPSPAITPPGPEHEGLPGGGLRRLLKAMSGGNTEIDAEYLERLQRPFYGARHIVVLGCTGGAGQTVTALMMGHTFAQQCGEPIVAIDVNPGPGALARRTRSQTPETLTGLIARAEQVTSLTAVRRYTSRAKSGLDVIAAGKNPVQALDDRDYALAFRTLDHFYSVTMLDAAAAIVARVLPYADQLILVAPASSDAARAVQMTFEWLDGHGYDELRARAVTVVNGVSRRSMTDVEHAESVARGRCRALVRIPWDDHLSLDRSPRNELKSLRAPTRRAYLALAGVVAGGFVVVPERYQEQEATR